MRFRIQKTGFTLEKKKRFKRDHAKNIARLARKTCANLVLRFNQKNKDKQEKSNWQNSQIEKYVENQTIQAEKRVQI